MQNLFTAENMGIAIQTIGAIIVAIIAKVGSDKVQDIRKSDNKKRTTPSSRGCSDLIGWAVMGVAGVITFFLIGIIYSAVIPSPTVTITNLSDNQPVECKLEQDSCSFTVKGMSSRVTTEQDLQIYVLLHPEEPPSPGWWFQIPPTPATVDLNNGQWSVTVWYGSDELIPEVGNTLAVQALVTTAEHVGGRTNVNDPKELKPEAWSNIITVKIGKINQ